MSTAQEPSAVDPGPEIATALQDLARLAWDAVPGCDGASVSLLHEDAADTVAATHRRIRELDERQYAADDGPCLTAMRDQVAVTVQDYCTDRRWPTVAAESLRAGIRSSLSLPLEQAGRTLGGLNLYGEQPAGFTTASQEVAVTFARQAVLMLGYLQQLHSERAARAREHEVASELQRSLLPKLPHLDGITAAARYLTSAGHTQVGGDWYDLFALPDGAIGVAVGDVMGHDVAAAAAMGQLRSVLRSYAFEGGSPSVVLDRLDRLVQGFEMAQLATAIYGRLTRDVDRTTLLFANAGHLPPLVRRPDGSVRRLTRATSPLIGAMPPGQVIREEAAVALAPGSLLVLYTDGLVETRTRPFDVGIETLHAALMALPADAGPDQACDDLLAGLVASDQDDDIALMVIHID